MTWDDQGETRAHGRDSTECLVARARLGSLPAFDRLVRRYRRPVTLLARQILGSPEQAEEVAQEVFLLAFKALPQLQDPARFAAWLGAITRRQARRVSAREGRAEVKQECQ